MGAMNDIFVEIFVQKNFWRVSNLSKTIPFLKSIKLSPLLDLRAWAEALPLRRAAWEKRGKIQAESGEDPAALQNCAPDM